NAIQERLNAFTASWEAHGKVLKASAEIKYTRFIIFIVDETQASVTGCSIDKSVAVLKTIEQEFNLSLFDRMQVAYRNEHGIQVCSKATFENLIAKGLVTENTVVFNNLVQNYVALQNAWEIPAKESWHSQLFSKSLS
ncbi:MAG: ABC transporter ATPase, partial [Sphingobacteriaceae bacterium]|nr:ABC transporter ATPase [Sphingobacteriaceae bacterium]